ncbi:NADP-dependent oxidoreductase [Actinokineospora enzanensis]|uniref:NADP-dependent oxidoreductase n=1 Tax=Actinokineospora enzanensis TaxID=155975 RepID=UPI0003A9AF86|nr:NADP-dependent oxidoreductase [Actinokineospora enzanensis]
MSNTHRAVRFAEYGGPEVLGVEEVTSPDPGPGEVLVRVHAAGINPIDWKLREGLVRSILPVELPAVPGADIAGVVVAVGADVTGFAAGDEVFGSIGTGGYAELAIARADQLAVKPAGLAWDTAAAMPVVVNTAYAVLAELDVRAGQTLLVDGAAGGVGAVAVQLARHLGARVIGTAGERNHDYLRGLGAEPTTYGDGLVDRVRALAPDGVDAAFDTAGQGSVPALIELTGKPDRVATIADFTAGGLGARVVSAAGPELPDRLAKAAALVLDGTLAITVARVFPLAEAAAAQEESRGGHVRGKLVLSITG